MAHEALTNTEARIDRSEGHANKPVAGGERLASEASESYEARCPAQCRAERKNLGVTRLVRVRDAIDIAASATQVSWSVVPGAPMTLTADRINELRAKKRRAAVATLVATTGGAIRRLGETMWVDDHGAIVGSVTIGGCIDGRAVELAETVLHSGASVRVSLPLGDEDAWAFGMTCAGTVDLLVEPVDASRLDDPVAVASDALRDAVHRGCSAIEAVTLGDRPRRLVIVEDGRRAGTLGHEMLDEAVARRARDLIDDRRTGVISVPHDAGVVEVFVHVHAPLPSLVVVGATDVAASLVQLASPLGFDTTVIDGRDRWANRDRFPTAGTLLVGMPSEIISTVPLQASTALVLLSHDFKYDLPVLEAALRTRVGYVGVLGSRRRATAVRDFLTSIGATQDDIQRVRMPVGLRIGARTPPEIALSVLAEIVAVRNAHRAAGDS
jgi:xanthine dehydrogenase accessory factor